MPVSRPSQVALCAVVVALVALPAAARAEVTGQLVVDGKPIKITHAYAYAAKGFFDPKKQDVVVVLCDAEVAPAAVHDAMARADLAKAGKLHCIEQTIDADKQVVNYKVQHQRFKIPESGGSSTHVFEARKLDGKTIAGHSRTTASQTSFDDVPYSYDVTFEVPIEPLK
ncbi:MAG TPA: hypothetical protein VMX54_04715 [Vicinamibacteria bacterium]|nr:hypothetical protein [Vicinamibacteria bacterium]